MRLSATASVPALCSLSSSGVSGETVCDLHGAGSDGVVRGLHLGVAVSGMRPTGATFRLVVERDHGRCAACGKDVWGARGYDYSLHHRRAAKMGGDRRPESHLAGNLVLLHGSGTTRCHGAVESAREGAERDGLLVREPADPATVPIQHAVHGLVLLDDEGGVTVCVSS